MMGDPILWPVLVDSSAPVPTAWVDVWPTYDLEEAARAVVEFIEPYTDEEANDGS